MICPALPAQSVADAHSLPHRRIRDLNGLEPGVLRRLVLLLPLEQAAEVAVELLLLQCVSDFAAKRDGRRVYAVSRADEVARPERLFGIRRSLHARRADSDERSSFPPRSSRCNALLFMCAIAESSRIRT